jgi:hypothetical protein
MLFSENRTHPSGRGPMGMLFPDHALGRRPIQKARDRFPGAGLILAMLNICQ